MLRSLVEASLRFRGVVIALACLAAGYGLHSALRARYDVFPEFAPPQVTIQTEAPGLSPEEVEQLVTRPVETAVNGVGGLERMASQSIQGLSVVTVTFADATDVYRARQLVGESLTQVVGRLPEGVAAPVMAPLSSSTDTVLSIGLTSDTRSPVDVRALADWTLRPRLLGVKGVSKVAVFGGEVRQLQVQIRPERLAALGVSLAEVLEAARRATGVRGAGFVESANQRVVVRTEGQALTAAELGECVVRRGDQQAGLASQQAGLASQQAGLASQQAGLASQQAGLASQQAGLASGLVRLRDVADVVEGAEPRFGAATVMGKPGVVLTISSQYGANTMEVTEALDAALAEMRPTIEAEGVRLHSSLFRPANFIADAIGNVRGSLLLGGGLVAVVLFLFLFNVRTAFISLTAIPLSLLVAVAVLTHLGLTLNTLTLGGLAIAIGEVVDDAIIDVENIHRRLRQPREGRSAFRIVLEASLEVRGAVIYATLVVAMVFLPVLTMSGIQGKLFAPLGLAYVLATLASLVVALTLTPALALVLLPASRPCQPGAWQGQPSKLALPVAGAQGDGEPPFSRWMKSRYGAVLAGAMRRPRLLVGSVLGLCVAAAAAVPFFGGAFLPELREGHFILHMSAVAGTSLDESLRIGGKVTEELLRNPHIRSVAQQAGRAEMGDDVFGPHYSEFQVDLVPLQGEEGELVQSEIRDSVARFPGLYFAIKPFLTERIEETVSGEMAAVAVKVYGDDLDAMDRTAARVAEVLSSIDGHADVKADPPPAQLPLMVVRLRPDRLKLFGLAGLDVLDAVQTAYQGTEVGRTYEGNRVTDVTVVLRDADRADPEGISRLLLRDARGGLLRLGEVADVFPSTGRYSVAHEAARRKMTVTCNVRGRDLASFVAEARSRVARDVEVPAGVQAPVFSGAEEAESAARREILLYSIVSAVGIILLLSIVYRSGRNLLLVLANVPFALVGGVMAVFLTGGWLSVGSLVGFVTLFGITTRNSIMLISHYEHLVREERMGWGVECAVRGALERLSPILMTAMVTGLGLLPIAIGTGDPGREIEGPMALVILGGLVTSTALNLLVLPTLALRFARFQTRAAEETT